MHNGIPLSYGSEVEWKVVLGKILDSRKVLNTEKRNKLEDLENLKSSLKHFQEKAQKLECELQTVKEQLKHYKVVIEDLKGKNELIEKNLVSKERNLSEIIWKLELEKINLTDKHRIEKIHIEKEFKENVSQLEFEKEQLNILVKNLKNSIKYIENERKNEDIPTEKQLTNSKAELSKLRLLFESSERDRLSEKKEKLLVIQNMVRLTKQLSDLDDELERKKKEELTDTKYIRLFDKYEDCMLKLKTFYETSESEKKEIRKKYLDEIRNLKIGFEKELRDINAEKTSAQKSLELFLKNNQFDDRNDDEVSSSKTSAVFRQEVLCETGVSEKVLLNNLFEQYCGIYKRCEESSRLIKEKNPNSLKEPQEENLNHLQKQYDSQAISDSQAIYDCQAVSDFEIAERAFKSQIESLLEEKKNSSIQLQVLSDDIDSHKVEIADIKKEKEDLEELLKNQASQIAKLNETISSLTHDLKIAEVTIDSYSNQFSKDAEILRLQTDFKEMEANFFNSKKLCEELRTDFNEQKLLTQHKDLELTFLRKKLIGLEQSSEAITFQLKHVQEERDNLWNTLNEKEGELLECNALHLHCESNFDSLKKQNTTLGNHLQEKIELLSSKMLEFELIQTELLATKYLLSEEEKRTQELEQTIQKLLVKLEEQGNNLVLLSEERIADMKNPKENSSEALLLKLEECIENNYQGFELLSSHNESSKFEELKQIAPEIDSMPHNKFNEDKNSENSKEHNNNKNAEESMNPLKKKLLPEEDNAILKRNLLEKESILQSLLQNIEVLTIEKLTYEDQLKKLTDQKTIDQDGLACLNNLVEDNEILSKYLEEQNCLLKDAKQENCNLKMQLQELLAARQVQEDSLLKLKRKLNDVMHTSLTRVSNISKEQQKEIFFLKEHENVLRGDINQLEINLKSKEEELLKTKEELLKTKEELFVLQRAIEYHQGSIRTEARALEFVENQMKMIVQDRSFVVHKLNSTELLNDMLQGKMKELQRWQNNLEIDFFKFGENPFSYQLFEENQKSRDKLFEYCMGQVKEKISKLNNGTKLNSYEITEE